MDEGRVEMGLIICKVGLLVTCSAFVVQGEWEVRNGKDKMANMEKRPWVTWGWKDLAVLYSRVRTGTLHPAPYYSHL